jgi:ketosteroid isomerase-like protein
MQTVNAGHVVRTLWERFDAQDWEAAGLVLADDVVVEWPHSGELIRGRDNVIRLNADYPGAWRIEIQGLLVAGDRVASQVRVTDGAESFWAASFFEVRDGLIRHIREFWVDQPKEPPPASRAGLVERL